MKTAIDLLRFAGTPGAITLQETTAHYPEYIEPNNEATKEETTTTEDM